MHTPTRVLRKQVERIHFSDNTTASSTHLLHATFGSSASPPPLFQQAGCFTT
jgi:hypothetical protein